MKFLFVQEIVRRSDTKTLLSAEVIGAAVNAQGRPFIPEVLEKLLI